MHFRSAALALNASAPPSPRIGRWPRGLKVGATIAAAVTTAAVTSSPTLRLQLCRSLGLFGPNSRIETKKKLRLSWLVVDALSGAVGEIASLAVLYPLDTIKVRCQAQSANAGTVLQELRAMGCNMGTVRALYAGMGSAALCSAAIGAVYLLTFYTVKRVGSEVVQRHQQRRQLRQTSSSAAHASSGRQSCDTSGSHLADGTLQRPPLNAEGTHPLLASLAGITASVIGSIFEAPMETFKLRAQAGIIPSGYMLGTMINTALRHGLDALYWSYGAFMIKSIPYDFAELVTYSHMCDLREAAVARRQQPSSIVAQQGGAGATWRERLGDLMANSPDGMGDMIIGAAAGAAAVLCSMPCDAVKTHMDLHHYRACPPGRNALLHSGSEFLRTGQRLVAKGGLQALFVGVTPRLLQTMPSTMVYWFAVEGTRRALMQYIDVEDLNQEPASAPLVAPLQPAAG